MKKFCYVFTTALLYTPLVLDNANATHNFDGIWQLNNADVYFGGELKIYNCTATMCDFKVQSWYDQHTCITDGQIVLSSETTGIYTDKKYMYDAKNDKEYSLPVGLNFETVPDDGFSLKYATPDSHSAFCGMSATLEGIWFKQKS